MFHELVFRLYELRHHVFHEVIDEDADSSRCREAPCGIVRLEYKPHLFQVCHVVSYRRTGNADIMLTQQRLRPRNFTGPNVLFHYQF